MSDEFLQQAGPTPARGEPDRWRQVALLGVSAAAFGDERARVGLAASLLALDCPVEAGRLLARGMSDDPWARWWTVLAVGQAGGDGLPAALGAARAEVVPRGEGREVARRLADLDAELRALAGEQEDSARFSVLGHRARPARRALLGGRSSAAFLVDPSWDSVRLVRLAPSDGPSSGNTAHLTFAEIIEAVRRGDSGPGRRVCDDTPAALAPAPMLEALREDPATRDGRLLRLATEVKQERERLADERASLAAARAEIADERARLRRARAAVRAHDGETNGRRPSAREVPKTAAEAAALLGVAVDASRSTIQRHWRDQVAKCHPDRVEGLHPSLRERAADLAVALNAARDLLLGTGGPRRAGGRG